MNGGWPAFDALLTMWGIVPSRTGSVISTVYGDAILPRGGSLALADLLVLMRRLGASDGVVRTAVSRLSADGILAGRRIGRSSAYALTERGRAEFLAAVPRIYGRLDREWDGHLRLAFPTDPDGRERLETAGFAALAPGVLLGFDPVPPGVTGVTASGGSGDDRDLVSRAWSTAELDGQYALLADQFAALGDAVPPTPLDAMAARTMVLHTYRRLALRTPRLPRAVHQQEWPGERARVSCIELYGRLVIAAESWLDTAKAGSDPLPRGPDPLSRFSGGDTRPSAPASSPARSGSPRQAR